MMARYCHTYDVTLFQPFRCFTPGGATDAAVSLPCRCQRAADIMSILRRYAVRLAADAATLRVYS